jgi:hypothetical protein
LQQKRRLVRMIIKKGYLSTAYYLVQHGIPGSLRNMIWKMSGFYEFYRQNEPVDDGLTPSGRLDKLMRGY